MLTAVALDDEKPALNILDEFCKRSDSVTLVKAFTNAKEALNHLSTIPTDLLFLDINMPTIKGLEFKKLIPPHIIVIFTTAYSEYAVEGFNLDAVDYLLKPFTFERFSQAVKKAKAQQGLQQQQTEQDYLLVRIDYALVKIQFSELLYVEASDDYLKIHLVNRKPVITRMTMKAINEKLPARDFIRVHKSFIVHLDKIELVRNKTILLAGAEIPIGISYEEKFFSVFGRQ